jgi:hypothetical protein
MRRVADCRPPRPELVCGAAPRSKAESDLYKQTVKFTLAKVTGPRRELFLNERSINAETYELFRMITLCTLVH